MRVPLVTSTGRLVGKPRDRCVVQCEAASQAHTPFPPLLQLRPDTRRRSTSWISPPTAHRVPRCVLSRHLPRRPARADIRGRQRPRCAAQRAGRGHVALGRAGVGLLPDGQSRQVRAAHTPHEPVVIDEPRQRCGHAGLNCRHRKVAHLFQGHFKALLVIGMPICR
jgi:hypothetical protein